MKSYVWDLGKLGFVWQFITLGGLHSNAYISDLFAAGFAKEGMKAYVELVQRKEREIGCDVLTHQKWSGANFVDACLNTVLKAASTSAMGRALPRPSSSRCSWRGGRNDHVLHVRCGTVCAGVMVGGDCDSDEAMMVVRDVGCLMHVPSMLSRMDVIRVKLLI